MDIQLFANDEERQKYEEKPLWMKDILARPEFDPLQIRTSWIQDLVRDVERHLYTSETVDNAQSLLESLIGALSTLNCKEMFEEREAAKERELDQVVTCFRCADTKARRLMLRPTNLYQHPAQQQYHCAPCLELLKEEYFYTCAICERRYSPYHNYNAYFCSACRTDKRAREATRVQSHIERAKSIGVPATLTVRQWIKTLTYFEWKCAYCPDEFSGIEHFLPISLGGGTTADNCLPTCKHCNGVKRDKHPADFAHLFESQHMIRIQAYIESVRQR